MLTDKYRPRKLSFVVGNKKVKERVKEWVEAYLSGKKVKPLLIYGPTGVGKTSLAQALAKEHGLELITLTASDKRDKKMFHELSLGSTINTSLFGKKKLILIDDIDALSREDRGAISGLAELIAKSKVAIIITANDPWNTKLSPLRDNVEMLEMKPLTPTLIREYLKRVAKIEGLDVEEGVLDAIAQASNGDLRAALNDLEMRARGFRDWKSDIFEVMKAIFKADSLDWPRKALFSSDVDIDMVKAWVDENIPNEYEDGEEVALAYEFLSKADVFQGRIMKRQYWGLLRYVSVLIAAVALAKKRKYAKFTRYRYPSYIREMTRTQAHRAKLKAVAKKIGRRLHLSSKRVIEDIALYAKQIVDGGEEARLYFKLSPEDIRFMKKLVR